MEKMNTNEENFILNVGLAPLLTLEHNNLFNTEYIKSGKYKSLNHVLNII